MRKLTDALADNVEVVTGKSASWKLWGITAFFAALLLMLVQVGCGRSTPAGPTSSLPGSSAASARTDGEAAQPPAAPPQAEAVADTKPPAPATTPVAKPQAAIPLLTEFSSDGRFVAVVGAKKNTRLFDVTGRGLLASSDEEVVDPVAVTCRPDASAIAVADATGTIHLWEPELGAPQDVFSRGTNGSASRLKSLSAPEAAVRAIAFHPTARELASVSAKGEIRLWKAGGQQFEVISPGDGTLPAGDFRRDGAVAAVMHSNGRIGLLSTKDGVEAAAIDLPVTTRRVALSPSGDRLLTSEPSGRMAVWSTVETKLLGESKGAPDSTDVAAFLDESTFAVGAKNGELRVWTLENIVPTRTADLSLGKTNLAVRAGVISATNNLALVDFSTELQLWDTAKGALLAQISNPDQHPCWLALPENRVAAVAAFSSGRIVCCEVKDGAVVWREMQHPSQITSFDLAARSSLFVVTDGGAQVHVCGWPEAPRALLGGGDPVVATCLSDDEKFFAAVSQAGEVRVWSLPGAESFADFETGLKNASSLTCAANAKALSLRAPNGSIHIWNVATRQKTLETPPESAALQAMSLSEEGTELAAIYADGQLRQWNLNSEVLQRVASIPRDASKVTADAYGHVAYGRGVTAEVLTSEGVQVSQILTSDRISDIAMLSKARMVVADAAGTVSVADPQTGKLRNQVEFGTSSLRLALAPESRQLAICDERGTIRVWQPRQELRSTIKAAVGNRCIALCPEAGYVAACPAPDQVGLWSLQTGEVFKTVDIAAPVTALAWSSDGQQIAAGTERGDVVLCRIQDAASIVTRKSTGDAPVVGLAFGATSDTLWSVNQLGELRSLAGSGSSQAIGNTGSSVKACGFSRDQARVAIATARGEVQIWDLTAMRLQHTSTHGDDLKEVALSPDGQQWASIGTEALRFWKVESTSPVATVALGFTGSRLASGPAAFVTAVTAPGVTATWNWDGTRLQTDRIGTDAIAGLASSRDGSLLARIDANGMSFSDCGVMRFWDSGIKSPAKIAISAAGNRVAIAGPEGEVRGWDFTTSREIRGWGSSGNPIQSLSITPAEELFVGRKDGTLELQHPTDTAQSRTVSLKRNVLSAVPLDKAGEVLLMLEDRQLVVCNLLAGEDVAALDTPGARIREVFASPGGPSLALDEAGTIWRIAASNGLRDNNSSPVTSAALSRPTRTIARVTEPDRIRLSTWTGQQPLDIKAPAKVKKVLIDALHRRVIALVEGPALCSWSLEDGASEASVELPKDAHFQSYHSASRILVLRQAGIRRLLRLSPEFDKAEVLAIRQDAEDLADQVLTPQGDSIFAINKSGAISFQSVGAPPTVTEMKAAARLAAISSDGRIVALVPPNQPQIEIWSTDDAKLLRTLEGGRDAMSALALSADGRTVVAAIAEQRLRAWNATTGEVVGDFNTDSKIRGLRISPDGQLLASFGTSVAGHIELWNLASHLSQGSVTAGEGRVAAICFAEDGRSLTALGSDRRVSKLPLPCLAAWEAHSIGIVCCQSVQGNQLLTTGADGRARLWSSKGELRWDCPEQFAGATVAALDGKGERLAVAGPQAGQAAVLYIYSVGQKKPMFKQSVGGEITRLQFGHQGKTLCCTRKDNQLLTLDVESGLWLESRPTVQTVAAITVDDSNGDALTLEADGAIRRYPSAIRAIWKGTPEPTCVVYSEDGSSLAVGSQSGAVTEWDVTNPRLVRKLEALNGPVNRVSFHQNRLLVCGSDGTVQLFKAGAEAPSVVLRHPSPVNDARLSHDGTWLATATDDKLIRLWKVGEERAAAQFDGHVSSVLRVAFLAGTTELASAALDSTVRVWPLPTEAQSASSGAAIVSRVLSVSPDRDDLLKDLQERRQTSDGAAATALDAQIALLRNEKSNRTVTSFGSAPEKSETEQKLGNSLNQLRSATDSQVRATLREQIRLLQNRRNLEIQLSEATTEQKRQQIQSELDRLRGERPGIVKADPVSMSAAQKAALIFERLNRTGQPEDERKKSENELKPLLPQLWPAVSTPDPQTASHRLATLKTEFKFSPFTFTDVKLAVSEDGQIVGAGRSLHNFDGQYVQGIIQAWDVPSGVLLRSWENLSDSILSGLVLAPREQMLLSLPNLIAFGLVDGHSHPLAPEACVAFSRPLSEIAVGVPGTTQEKSDIATFFAADTLDIRGEPLRGFESWATALAYSPDGRLIAVAVRERTRHFIQIIDASSRQAVLTIDEHRHERPWINANRGIGNSRGIDCMCFSGDSQTLVTHGEYGEGDYKLRCYDLNSRRLRWEQEKQHRIVLSTVELGLRFVGNSPVCMGRLAEGLVFFDVRSRQGSLLDLRGRYGTNVVFSLSENGTMLAIGDSVGRVFLLHLPTWIAAPDSYKPLEFRAHDGPVVGVGLSASGSILVTAGEENLIHVWTLAGLARIEPATTKSKAKTKR